MDDDGRKADLTIYLLRDSVENYKEALNNAGKLKEIKLKDDGKEIGVLYIKQPFPRAPKWARFFEGHVETAVFGKNASAGAVFFVATQDRYFALSFGQGRHLLDTQHVEANFGFRVTLNVVDPQSVRSIDKTSLETHPRQLREQAGKETALQYFGLDVEQDLLRAVTGRPIDPKRWGERVSGMDSLKLSLPVGPADLRPLCVRMLKEFESTAYRGKGFAFVDHIGEVKDTETIEALDELLIDKLNTKHIENIWMAVPDVVDWEKAVGFKYSNGGARVYDVRVSDFLDSLDDAQPTKALLQRKRIMCVDANDEVVLARPAYSYLYTELSYNSQTYLLNNSKWYAVEKDFVKQITDYYQAIPAYAKALPEYEDDSEGDYNERVAAESPAEYAPLDQDNIYLSGAVSPVEPCDLYRTGKEFIHVKRYGGSSLFSHLFNQGLVSAELFRREPKFRELLNKKLPDSHKLEDPSAPPGPNEYKVVYGVISESSGALNIPFFSKISLRHAKQRLNDLGFVVELAKVDVKSDVKNFKALPAKHPKLKKVKTPVEA